MKKLHKSQNGFSAVEVILVIVIVGLLGGLGYYVWSQNKKDRSETTSTTTSTKKTEVKKKTESQDETLNWKEESNAELGYSYKYPNETGWENLVQKTATDSEAYAAGERINNSSVHFMLCGRNCGAVFSLRVFIKGSNDDVGPNYIENVQMKDNNYYKLASKTTVTKNSAKGTRWEYQPGDTSSAKIVYYYFTNGNYAYSIYINDNGAITDKIDITERGEKVFSTLQFMN